MSLLPELTKLPVESLSFPVLKLSYGFRPDRDTLEGLNATMEFTDLASYG